MLYQYNIANWVKYWSESHPEKPAIFFENNKITYRMLQESSQKVAAWLDASGIHSGDRVAVMLRNCPEFVEIYLACAQIGAILVPLNTRWTHSELNWAMNNAEPNIVIYESSFGESLEIDNRQRYPEGMILSRVGDSKSGFNIRDYHAETRTGDFRKQPDLNYPYPEKPEQHHVIMYTSGTSGRPKGALLALRKTYYNCLNAGEYFNFQHDDIMLVVSPLYHSGGLFIQVSPCLFYGATMVIHQSFNPIHIYHDIENYRITKFSAVPTMLRMLLDVPVQNRADISSLIICAIGGEKVTTKLLDLCRCSGFPIRQIMGQTETSIILWASEEDLLSNPNTIGKPVCHGEVEIFDNYNQPVYPGIVGELVVRGPICMSGYWKEDKKTQTSMKKGWLHTGDLAWRGNEGYFFFSDRKKDMYISGGENVYPAEVESVLKDYPEIAEVAVIGIADEKWGEVGHAYIIKKNGTDFSLQMLEGFLQNRLARFKWPKKMTFCKKFPKTSTGKIKKYELPAVGEQKDRT
ncbi:MAG: AMP-binding protein [Desulfatiglandaceae bacterium]